MPKYPVLLREFLESLSHQRLAIVYSDRFEGQISDTWYHRWRTDIVGFYSEAGEALGMELTFLNVDQLIDLARVEASHLPDFLVNLNAGNRFLGNLVIAPALASWRRKTMAFCDTRTALLSEDKPTSRLMAREAGFKLPSSSSDLQLGELALYKPTNLGSSVGVYVHPYDGAIPDGYMVEAFIQGYDGTLVLVPCCEDGILRTIAAQLVVPDVEIPLEWIYSEIAKEESDAAPPMEFVDALFDTETSEASERLAAACGCNSVARIDFRYTGKLGTPSKVTTDTAYFVELNALPTMGRKNNVISYTRKYLAAHSDNVAVSYLNSRSKDQTLIAAMYLLGTSLYKNQFQMK